MDSSAVYIGNGYRSYAVRLKDLADRLRYRQWKESKGISLATTAEDDSDADGIGLLEEYAFGMDPLARSSAGAPIAGVEGTDVTLTYQLDRARTDLTLEIQESLDLVTWTPSTVSSTSTVLDNGSLRTYKAKVPMAGADRKFLRIKISGLTS